MISMDLAVAPAFDQRFTPCHGKDCWKLLNWWTLGFKLFVPSLLISETSCNTSVFCHSPSWDYLFEYHLNNQASPPHLQNPSGMRLCVCEAKGLGRCGQVSFETNPCAGIPLSALNLSCLPGASHLWAPGSNACTTPSFPHTEQISYSAVGVQTFWLVCQESKPKAP